jgi:hypothetical protein
MSPGPSEPAPGSLAARLAATRARAFVGRAAELELFRSALLADEPPFVVLWLYGPGGVGKTTLLRRLADEAAANGGGGVRVVDGRVTQPTPRGFLDAVGADGWPAGVRLLLVDTAEALGGLETWLREEFLPLAPARALVVIASRREPEPGWASDPAWSEALRTVSLRNLPPDEAAAFLRRRQVPDPEVPGVLAFTHGHPLALALVADVVAQRRAGGRPWRVEDSPDIVATLLGHLVRELPSGRHRDALDILMVSRVTTEELLRHALDETDPEAVRRLFDWLRGLSFVLATPYGLVPHDIAREAISADLRWRDRERYVTTHKRVRRHIVARLLDPDLPDRRPAMADLLFLHRYGRIMRDFYDWDAIPPMWADRAAPCDRDLIVALVERYEGPESARLAAAWWEAQPEAFTVFRGAAGRVDGFVALVEVTLDDVAVPGDPVVAAALRWAARRAPMRTGERMLIGRWVMGADQYLVTGAMLNLVAGVTTVRWLSDPPIAVDIEYMADGDYWEPMFTFIDQIRTPEADAVVGGRRYAAFTHDWRVLPAVPWLEMMEQRELAEELTMEDLRPAVPALALSQPDFAEAVKRALRCCGRPDELSRNALVRSRLVHPDGSAGALRRVLVEAVSGLAADPRDGHLGRVLEVTYLKGGRTQEAAANRLGLPFSTYRRHLATALDRVTCRLWERELYGS